MTFPHQFHLQIGTTPTETFQWNNTGTGIFVSDDTSDGGGVRKGSSYYFLSLAFN